LTTPTPAIFSLALAAALLAGCQTPPPTSPEEVGEYRKGSGYLNGYMNRKQLPDSLALLPPPPAAGTETGARLCGGGGSAGALTLKEILFGRTVYLLV
jgi:hypothetical protein